MSTLVASSGTGYTTTKNAYIMAVLYGQGSFYINAAGKIDYSPALYLTRLPYFLQLFRSLRFTG